MINLIDRPIIAVWNCLHERHK